MGRNKNKNPVAEINNEKPESNMSIDGEILGDVAESSNIVKDDRTSADYYFDSYSHFGIHEVRLTYPTLASQLMNISLLAWIFQLFGKLSAYVKRYTAVNC